MEHGKSAIREEAVGIADFDCFSREGGELDMTTSEIVMSSIKVLTIISILSMIVIGSIIFNFL